MLTKNSSRVIYENLEYLTELINSAKPLAKLFETYNNSYIYDTGTGKVLQCEGIEYQILKGILNNKTDIDVDDLTEKFGEQKVLEALEDIKSVIENEHILKAPRPKKFYSPGHFEKLEYYINNALDQVVLELTERCNLRCGYCIYGTQYEQKRDHGEIDMSKEIAEAAIDYLKAHGDPNKSVALTFYGGEPLLKFDLLKYCISYAQKIISKDRLTFSLTTNLTLVTPEIAAFLASVKNLNIVCSLDGPKDLHDYYRRDVGGNGTFDSAIRGLKYMVDALGDSVVERLSLSMVFGPPYTKEKLDRIDEFYKGLDWLPASVGKRVTYPATNSVPNNKLDDNGMPLKVTKDNMEIDNTLASWSEAKYFDKLENNDQIDFFTKSTIDDALVRIHKRHIYAEPMDDYTLNGCCLPACRRIYVTAKGGLMLCERIDGAPSIGNVFTGIDLQKVKSVYIDEYSKASIKHCSNCWALRLCDLCYISCYSEGQLDIDKKILHCNLTRSSLLNSLIAYHSYMEKNPEKLRFLNDMTVS
ncbi:radical SAM protein [Ruminiclostridium cellobioparum]|uniref:Arylsulfatase regulator (Fe-S oxidoreductase) n=1 Tax=Ruminiclostridium cellobioparum subsp. termitidis CT1112 TaxID=1195236 RepID=S0FKL3_RUMCE|nr:radical SAM protein [Ruminiclostridium cellobioparum]EMS69068.1 Arylsulfatase regulator (Fe-S oxidoreductase) [Ruminiclostridium cellobioparum subsp. termitidis CT1112]